MAVVALTVQTPTVKGDVLTPQAATATDGYTVQPGGKRLLVQLFNGTGSPVVATVVVPGTFLGQALPDIAVSIPANSWSLVKLDPGMVDPDTGLVTIGLASATTQTAVAIEV